MKNYQYTARDSSGKRKEGSKQANSANDVLSWLASQQMTPISVQELKPKSKKRPVKGRRKPIKSADLSALCWQLTTMVDGGIPITNALDTLSEDIDNQELQDILTTVVDKMKKGDTLSKCLGDYPKVFNSLSRALILAGETGGNLGLSLRRLAEYFDNRDKLTKKVKSAVSYPIFVFSFIVIIVIFIMAFIIPRFRMIFDQLGSDLPGFTKGFMAFYDFLRHNLVYLIGGTLLIVFASVLISKTRKGHYAFCKIALSIPLIGKILHNAFIVNFCKTISTLLGSGVSVLEVFDIISTMTNNDIIKNAIIQTRENIVQGSDISSSLSLSGYFPNMVVKMVQVGEESGSLPIVLERTADYYERKTDATISTVTGLLEPIMIVVVGSIVTVITLALYLPIFNMSQV